MRRPGEPVPDPDAVRAALQCDGLEAAEVLAAVAGLVLDYAPGTGLQERRLGVQVALVLDHAERALRDLERARGRVLRFGDA
jgi:hypothetical protein